METIMGIVIEENIMVPMRDGIKLATDIYRPEGEGQWPVLLTRVPYNKSLSFPVPGLEDKRIFLELNFDVALAVQAGYVVVAQDTRGRYASEGEFTVFSHDDTDGADTIAWAASQPWSTGKVGMFGVSYQGITQRQAARERPEALRAIAPTQCPADMFNPYRGGAFMLGVTLDVTLTQFATGEVQRRVGQGRATQAELEAIVQAEENITILFERLPLIDMPLLQDRAPYYYDWLLHSPGDEFWEDPEAEGEEIYGQTTVPALTIAGWYDFFQSGDLAYYRGMKLRGGSVLACQQQHLVIGPWAHGNFGWGFEERNLEEPGVARELLTEMQLRWYDHWLKGIENGLIEEKPVRIFVMGIDQWREEEDWPLPDTHYRPYYLHSQGHANSAAGDGTLSLVQAGNEPVDVYRYDPLNPVPTMGGAAVQGKVGPCDQRLVEEREDVLCYTTPPLEWPVEVTGPVELVVYVSSSAPDTDFTGKLVDVHPDGRAEILTDGILRARYRESLSQPALLEPDSVYALHIDLGATSNVFKAGHRIRLEVSSSNFPRFDRNSNTGGTIAIEGKEDFVVAENRVYHSGLYASHLVLPLIER
jgi:putative CocE/NonD family hydrolase